MRNSLLYFLLAVLLILIVSFICTIQEDLRNAITAFPYSGMKRAMFPLMQVSFTTIKFE